MVPVPLESSAASTPFVVLLLVLLSSPGSGGVVVVIGNCSWNHVALRSGMATGLRHC
jgi:hypothetical protein